MTTAPPPPPVPATWCEILRSGLMSADAVRKGPSVTHPSLGAGVMANVRIEEGAVACSYGGRVIDRAAYEHLQKTHDWRCPRVAYFIPLRADDDAWVIDGHPSHLEAQAHCGQYVNDARDVARAAPNVRFVIEALNGKPVVFLRATRTIEPGEELFLDYGDDYWTPIDETNGLCDRQCIV